MSNYKSAKEAFVSGMTGSSVGHVNAISAVALASIALHSALKSRLPASNALHFLVETLVLVTPLLLSMTLFAANPGHLIFMLLFPMGLLLLLPRRETGTPLPSSTGRAPSPMSPSPRSTPENSKPGAGTSVIVPLPALTTYRAHMMLMTILGILAVDFPVFPRALAKCETYGVSLMDLGVGSFVFSQGVVSAIPLIKDPAHLTAPLAPKLRDVLRKCAPVIALGVVRVLLVKGTEYPEHATEYGIHWNFFITLALLPVLQVFLHPLIARMPVAFLGSLVAVAHQMALSLWGLEGYVLNAPRVGLISANKEGIVSLTGYLAIHILGLSTGTLLLPPTPSHFRRQQRAQLVQQKSNADTDTDNDSDEDVSAKKTKTKNEAGAQRQNDKTAIELVSYAFVWWMLLGVASIMGVDEGVSRRMANISYVLWVVAFNTSFIFGYLCLDLIFFPSPLSRSVYSATSGLKVPAAKAAALRESRRNDKEEGNGAPILLDAINRNSLVLFLIANVATGLINMSMATMYASDQRAILVLGAYAMGICAFAWRFRGRRIWNF
ncbi:GWT1-domain-containing protein [Athelia psychrophila]|uniref:GPI-anchored wall transfer protein n=1 Tax=Athelia psychrophila TaxID=1759441 RepID=A0A166FNQ5_9AGAM|nr:GWT1-domain-containing protein [Fibularhizoctonia sp. CBS 109695]